MSIEAQLAATRKELDDLRKSFSMYQGLIQDELNSLRHLASLREAQLFGESGESVILNNPILYAPQIPTPKGVESFTTGAEGGGIPPAGTPEESETTFNRDKMARVLPTARDPNNVVDVFHTGVLFDGNTSVPGSIWRVGTSIGTGFPSSQFFVIEDDTGNYFHFGNGSDLSPHLIVNGTDLLLPDNPFDIVDAKGDLIVGTADNTVDRLPVNSDFYLLMANSATDTGLEWISPFRQGQMWLPATGFIANLNTPALTGVAGTTSGVGNARLTPAWEFDSDQNEGVVTTFIMPEHYISGTNMNVSLHWAPSTSGSGSVTWRLRWAVVDFQELIDQSTNTFTETTATNSTVDEHLITSFTDVNAQNTTGEYIKVQVVRDADDAEDDYGDDARFIGLQLEFEATF